MSWWKRIFSKPEEVEDPMKYLIVGLGNIGPEYDNTRHNIGFDIADALAAEFEAPFKHEQLGDLAEFKFKGRTFFILKPSTYMNRSGKAVRFWMQKKKVQKTNLIVIVDDLNLSFGSIRIRGKGKDGGHNGLKDIDQLTGGNNYARLRIGIGNDYHKGAQVNFVLGAWNDSEKEQLPEIIDTAKETVKSFCTIGLQHTMSKFNRKG